MPACVTEKCMSNVEIDGSTRKKRVTIGDQFQNDPIASSILYTMRDPMKGSNCGGMKRMKLNDVEVEHLLEMYEEEDEVETRPSNALNKEASQRYKDVMSYLLKPASSYTLLYEPHLVPTSKTPYKKKGKCKSTQQNVQKSRPPTKKEAQFSSFPRNVRTLTVTGMLDGARVQYLSASKEKELRGVIKGPSYLCGCKSCNYSKEVNAYEFESHAGCKTSHPNNHIHLENGKTLHFVVQELKETPPTMLCDAIQTLTAPSLNREAFDSWKESFEACLAKGK
ncbi:uncharacterized protein LOC131003781 [Salvia miltiorrhiza]|uniref:uncharacterized protein LOC131003781 n=1 Tax=Salvia miltiorrhiza TaxID=226208 RepID=UPI0025AB767A|nr:uncharacterized protein LOC131003781 [Salvia miltiorrhiza]XP_057786316.1 uncharacterized protein LOC131003781 [Salvia miltiorrhiza]